MVEGEKCIRELCDSAWEVERIYFTQAWSDSEFWESSEKLRSSERMEVSAKDMDMMTAMKTAPGLLAVAHAPKSFDTEPTGTNLTLYLDNVADPGNVGTLIRVADWFGLSGVVLSPKSADPLGPKSIQSAMGSTFHVPICVKSLDELSEHLCSFVVGLDAGGENLFNEGPVSSPSLLVIGSESHGLSASVQASCHAIASIPGAGRAESLNASVAGAIAVAGFIQQGLAPN